jgi:hypothetical protein
MKIFATYLKYLSILSGLLIIFNFFILSISTGFSLQKIFFTLIQLLFTYVVYLFSKKIMP